MKTYTINSDETSKQFGVELFLLIIAEFHGLLKVKSETLKDYEFYLYVLTCYIHLNFEVLHVL